MNVVIMTDLEGISMIDSIDMIFEDDKYQLARVELMRDVNAAVEGAFDGGASEVYVIDGHGGGVNFIPGALHSKALLLSFAEWCRLTREGKFHAYMSIGAHAMPGTKDGFLDHVQSSKSWFSYKVNGTEGGETAQGAIYMGAFGVPFVMVSGDEAACLEARALLGDIATAVVKHGKGRNNAICLPAEEARKAIYDAANLGMKLALNGDIKPYTLTMPLEIELTFYRSDMCDDHPKEGWQRLDGRTLKKTVHVIYNYKDIL